MTKYWIFVETKFSRYRNLMVTFWIYEKVVCILDAPDFSPVVHNMLAQESHTYMDVVIAVKYRWTLCGSISNLFSVINIPDWNGNIFYRYSSVIITNNFRVLMYNAPEKILHSTLTPLSWLLMYLLTESQIIFNASHPSWV